MLGQAHLFRCISLAEWLWGGGKQVSVSDPAAVLEFQFGAESPLTVDEVDALRAALSLDVTIESPVVSETSGQFLMPSLAIDAERLATMLEQLGRRSLLDQNLKNATTFFRLALRCWIGIEGSRNERAVSCAHELAVAERNAGDFEMARSLLNAILAIRNETLGDAHPETLMTVNDLAVVELDLDDSTAARGRLIAAVKVSAESYGAQDENTLKLEGNLADALRRLGELKEALGIESRVLKTRQDALGHQHPEVLDAMNNLAATHLELGHLPEARALQEEVLRLRRVVLPRNHADTMTAMANLAVTLYRMGRFQDAVGLERQVVADRQQVLGADHPDTWMALNNLSGSLRDIGETAEAKSLLEDVLQRSTEQLGPEHQYVLLVETNLADACSKTGDYDRAYELATHAWTIRKEKEGLHHPFTLLSEATAAAVLFEMGQAEQALDLQNHVVSARKDALGPDHFDTLGARNDLGKLLWRKGELDQARRIYEDVFERGSRVLGEHHPDIQTTRLNLSEVFFQLGDAESARRNAWPIAQQISGKSVVYGDDYELANRSFALLVRTEPSDELQPLFERVSLAMWNALEVRTHDSLSPLWRHFAAFHETWQNFCLVQALEDLPKALIAMQGLEVSAGIIDDFSSDHTTPERSAMAVARQSLANARVRMEQLDSQLARVSEEAQTGLPRIAERRRTELEAERSLQVTEERDAVRRYEEAKDTLAADEPSLAAVLRPPRPTASDLEKTLASGETLVLMWRSSDGYVASTIGAAIRGHVSLPDFNAFVEASIHYERRVSRGRGRRIAMRSAPADRNIPRVSIFALRELCASSFWRPLVDSLGGATQVSIATAPGIYSLPFDAGNPGIAARYFTGLPSYCRLRLIGRHRLSEELDAQIAIDPAWSTRVPIPFVEAEARLIEQVVPKVRMVAAESIGVTSASRIIVACHGMVEGRGKVRYPVLLLDLARGYAVDHSRLQAVAGKMSEFYCSACVGGLVSHTLAGDAFGIVSALQLRGVDAVIASSASLPDFYMPIVSVLYWRERRNGLMPQDALRAAKAMFKGGAWPEELIERIRSAYREQIEKVLARARVPRDQSDPKARRIAYELAATSREWLWPERQGRFDHERFSRDYCEETAARSGLAARLADHLIANRHRLPLETIEHVCGFLTCFG